MNMTELNRLIAKVARRIQLTVGRARFYLRLALRRLNMARADLRNGDEAFAIFNAEIAWSHVRAAKLG